MTEAEIVRGARVVVDERARTYHREHGVVLSSTKWTALVRLDAGESVYVDRRNLRPERDPS